MAEKKKTELNDADKQFLEKSGVTSRMKDLLTKVLANRPADPIDFILKYFESNSEKGHYVAKAQNQIRLVHYQRPSFESNVRLAYDILSQNKGSLQIKGITGNAYMELITSLTGSFPSLIKEKILKKLYCRDHEVLSFEVFRSAILICSVLQEFIRTAEKLYRQLDAKGTDKLDAVIGNVIVNQLKEAVTKTSDTPASFLEAGYLTTPDRLYSSLATAMFRNASGGTMTSAIFVNNLTEIFLQKINNLR